jgi:hypothetical protein
MSCMPFVDFVFVAGLVMVYRFPENVICLNMLDRQRIRVGR